MSLWEGCWGAPSSGHLGRINRGGGTSLSRTSGIGAIKRFFAKELSLPNAL